MQPRCSKMFAIFIAGILLAGNLSAQNLPHISNTFPPPEDIRSPDRAITNAEKNLTAMAYNSNGRFLATAGADNVIHLRDAATGEKGTGELVRSFEGHTARILGIGFSGTNSMISVSEDQTIKTWDLSTGKITKSVTVKIPDALLGPNYHARAAFCPSTNTLLAVGGWRELSVWDYESGNLVAGISGDFALSVISGLAFTSDGKFLVTATYQGEIKTWD